MFEIGNTLREARVRRSLTLQQVEEDTKIRVKYVQAMENEEFDVMPGATYVKGFLRTYSVYLGLDPDVMLDEYRSRVGGGRRTETHEPFGGSSMLGKPHSHRGRNAVVLVALICLGLLVIIIALGWNGPADKGTPTTKPKALGIESASPKPTHTPTARPSPTVKPGFEDTMRLIADGGSAWVEVRRVGATGVVLYSGTLAAGKGKTFKGKTLWVRLADPSKMKVILQGRTHKPIHSTNQLDFLVEGGKMKRQG